MHLYDLKTLAGKYTSFSIWHLFSSWIRAKWSMKSVSFTLWWSLLLQGLLHWRSTHFYSNAYVIVNLVVWSKNIKIDRSRSSVPKWNCTSSYLRNNCNCDMVKITDITCNTIWRSKNICVYLVLNVLQSM